MQVGEVNRYPTKVDAWIPILLVVSFGIGIVAVVATGGFTGLLLLPAFGIVILVCWPCEYIFAQEELIVRSGIIRWKIPYKAIDVVKPTRNPLSSPAWSLDRLHIKFGKKEVMISPARREEFMQELRARTGLKRVGDELVR